MRFRNLSWFGPSSCLRHGRSCCGNTSGYTPSMAKVMVSLPDDLLARIDREAMRRSTSRSALLSVAAVRELERRDSDEVAAAITRSENRFRTHSGAFDAADLIRQERDSRP
jgi:predicted transcriptional regulator